MSGEAQNALRNLPKDAKKRIADLLIKLSESVRENQSLAQKYESDKTFWEAERETLKNEIARLQDSLAQELENRKQESTSSRDKFQEAVRLVKTYQVRIEELLAGTESLYEEKLSVASQLSSTQQLLSNLQADHSRLQSRLAEVEAELEKERHHFRVLELARERTRQILVSSGTRASASTLPRSLQDKPSVVVSSSAESVPHDVNGFAKKSLRFDGDQVKSDWRTMLNRYLDESPGSVRSSKAVPVVHSGSQEAGNESLEYSVPSVESSPCGSNRQVVEPDDQVVVDQEFLDLMNLLDQDALLEKRYVDSPLKMRDSPLKSSQPVRPPIEDEIHDILEALRG